MPGWPGWLACLAWLGWLGWISWNDWLKFPHARRSEEVGGLRSLLKEFIGSDFYTLLDQKPSEFRRTVFAFPFDGSLLLVRFSKRSGALQ